MYLRTMTLIIELLTTIPVIAGINFGRPGEPIHLVVGYQPHYTLSWSAIVNKHQGLWKKYLPMGSTVEFQPAFFGFPITQAMVEGKQHIGYMGDMPAIAATFRVLPPRGGVDIRIVGVLGVSHHCGILLVKNQAPATAVGQEAIRWLQGKTVATMHGTCADYFAQQAFSMLGVKPRQYPNQSFDIIEQGFRDETLDAAIVWEPKASQIENSGIARRAVTSQDLKRFDSGFIVALNDLIIQRPDVVKGWLEAELEAQKLIMNSRENVIKIVSSEVPFKPEVLQEAFYGHGQETALDFIVTERVKQLLDEATVFLYSLSKKPAAMPQLRKEAVLDGLARQVLQEHELDSPIGIIK